MLQVVYKQQHKAQAIMAMTLLLVSNDGHPPCVHVPFEMKYSVVSTPVTS